MSGNARRARPTPRSVKLVPGDRLYPPLLRRLDLPPTLTVSGPLDTTKRAVAIVGSRSASPEARDFAFALAYHLARAGVTIVSGGAEGIDRTAHEAAMRAGGTTWLVSPTGRGRTFPPAHAELFATLERSRSSRVIWPFPDGTPKDPFTPRYRNGVLVALSECVVVVQAQLRSGSRNAASWGRQLGCPVYVVPGTPWMEEFKGAIQEGARGAKALWSIEWLFAELGLEKPDMRDPNAARRGVLPPSAPPRRRREQAQPYTASPRFPVDPSTWTEDEKTVFSALSMLPLQQDAIVEAAGLQVSSTLTALLTLCLKDVVVEGPDGFFRRRIDL